MTLLQWTLFFFLLQIVHFFGTWKLYKTAGFHSWQALIPIYNAYILMKIIHRPTWWVLLLFIPTINLIMFIVIWVEILRSFGWSSLKNNVLVIITLGFYIYALNYSKNQRYIPNISSQKRTNFGETVGSILFAIVAATIVHNYVICLLYTSPSPRDRG